MSNAHIHPDRQSRRSRSRSPPPPWRNREQQDRRRDNPSSQPRNGQTSYAGRGDYNQSRDNKTKRNLQLEDEQMREWVSQEDAFALKQAKKRAEIRMREGRAKPIDQLAVLLRFIDTERTAIDDEVEASELEVVNPAVLFDGLGSTQLSELEKDIDSFLQLETTGSNRDYWKTMHAVCKERQRNDTSSTRVTSSVSADVDKILAPKSLAQLQALEGQIKQKLRSNEPIDFDFWESMQRRLQVYKAKAELAGIFERASSAQTRQSQGLGNTRKGASAIQSKQSKSQSGQQSYTDPEAALFRKLRDKTTGSSPSDYDTSHASTRFAALPDEDLAAASKAFESEVARGMDEDEEVFAGEEDTVTAADPLWSDKYRPRKPRYFNRVQMGYEWNKYNQTHYDQDNPPPKVVQGYKFNVFYPELIDKSKAPTYKIEREGGRKRGESFAPAGEEDTCLIRFVAGAPYEDIAFRIVDRDWDYSAKRASGFRCTFEKGVLQLHFQFKKVFYRK